MKLTPWFPAEVKPVRVGVYECGGMSSKAYSYWSGDEWMCRGCDGEGAYALRNDRSTIGKLKWRGLAKQPKGAK